MQGIVETCSAPVAVTRRCPFLVSSSLNPAESANPATAACTRAVPAWISNWTNPSLPRRIEVPASTQRGSSRCRLFPRSQTGGFSVGRGWEDAGAVHFGGWGVERRSAGQSWRTYRWILGFSFSSYSPFPFGPICVYVSTRVCVYI